MKTTKEEALERLMEAYDRTKKAMDDANELDNPNEGFGEFLKEYEALIEAYEDYLNDGGKYDLECSKYNPKLYI